MAAKRAGCKDASNALVLCCVALCWQFLPAVVDENVKLWRISCVVCCRYVGAEKLGKERLLHIFSSSDDPSEAHDAYSSL